MLALGCDAVNLNQGLLGSSDGKTSASNPILGLGRFPGERNGNPLQYSCLENSMDRGTWHSTVHGEVEDPGGLESMEKSIKRAWWARVHGEVHGQKSLRGQSPWGCRGRQDRVTSTFTFTLSNGNSVITKY